MRKKIKAGIIGLGRIASLYETDIMAKKYYPFLTHAGTYTKHPSVELVCGADIDKGKLKLFSSMWEVKKVYEDYNQMLEENDLDLLSICTYPDKHFEIIQAASKFVKVIFCEKPFATNSDEILKIIDLQNRQKIKIAINLYREYDKSHLKVRELLNLGRYGKIQRVSCYYGKGLRNMGTHLLGYLIGTLGIPNKIKVLGKKAYEGIEEFTYDVYIEFGGIPVVINACDFDKYRLFELDFICEDGRVQILDEGLSIRGCEVRKNRAEAGAYELREKKDQVKSSVGSALYYAVDHLVQLCKERDMEPLVSPERYLSLQLVIEEIERQGRNIICHQN